ncbi:plasmid stability protein [Burkholderia cenocepacia]|uniref:Plasmid stability protein n=1 Tax=Burkholderia cenocepacia TaxID=95486 RepID=A0A3Q9FFB9_9BURK|nr:plasmid stability protein [Burkholderia cenocepacia]
MSGGRLELGTTLAGIGREAGGVDFDVEPDNTPTHPMSFE